MERGRTSSLVRALVCLRRGWTACLRDRKSGAEAQCRCVVDVLVVYGIAVEVVSAPRTSVEGLVCLSWAVRNVPEQCSWLLCSERSCYLGRLASHAVCTMYVSYTGDGCGHRTGYGVNVR